MSAPAPAPIVWEFDSVGLSELESGASLLTRKDRKYLVSRMMLDLLMDDLQEGSRVLEIGGQRTFTYESVYFDTPELTSYLAAAHSRPRRFKVRTRNYVDSKMSLLELKARDRRGMTIKQRMPYEFDLRDTLTPEALEFLGSFEQMTGVTDRLRKTLTTRYHRTTLLDTTSASRITIDTCMECTSADGSRFECPDLAIVETKTNGRPCDVDHLLWSAHVRPAKVSKYCTSLAALEPTLPANKWNPVLKTHFNVSRRADSARRIA